MSRLTTIEERKKQKKAILLILTSFALLFGLFFYGPGLIGQITSVVFNIRATSKPNIEADKTPPVSPIINSIPEATNKKTITLTGSAEAGSTLKIFLNGKNVKETLVDNSAVYSLEVELEEGENEIWATATDQAGNESPKSRKVIINFDTKPPDLEIESPKDGEIFYGTDQTIKITGKAEPGVRVTVNDRVTLIGSDGTFSLAYTLSEGENTLSVQAIDRAGNKTEKEIKINYVP